MQRLVIEETQRQDDSIILSAEQQHYLKRVLRLGEGDRVLVMDGRGKAWLTQLKGDGLVILEPIASIMTELPISVTLMVALPKGNGFDEVVRCCTELGVTRIIPVMSDRTLLQPSPNKLDRWRRIIMEATEQSERGIVPILTKPMDFNTAIQEGRELNCPRYICVARGETPHLLSLLRDLYEGETHQKPKDVILMTGCEGGWTEEEVKSAIAAGFQPVSLGRRILRAVTAPIVALSLVASVIEASKKSLYEIQK